MKNNIYLLRDLFLNENNSIFYFDKFLSLFNNATQLTLSGTIGNDGIDLRSDKIDIYWI